MGTNGFVSGRGLPEPADGQFMWYNDKHDVMRWEQCLLEDQDKPFKAFVLDGETQCDAKYGMVKKGAPAPSQKRANPGEFNNGWGEGYWRRLQNNPYHQTGSNLDPPRITTGWIRPIC